MALGPFSGFNPISRILVHINILDPAISEELAQRLQQPGISSGLKLIEAKPDKVKVLCEHWVNVNQLERLFKVCTTAIFNKNQQNSAKK